MKLFFQGMEEGVICRERSGYSVSWYSSLVVSLAMPRHKGPDIVMEEQYTLAIDQCFHLQVRVSCARSNCCVYIFEVMV